MYRYNCLNEKNKQRSKHKKVNLTLCTQTILEVYKTRVNGIVLSKSLNFFNRSLNCSTCIRAFAIRLVKKFFSFVKVARFPRNSGIKTVA